MALSISIADHIISVTKQYGRERESHSVQMSLEKDESGRKGVRLEIGSSEILVYGAAESKRFRTALGQVIETLDALEEELT